MTGFLAIVLPLLIVVGSFMWLKPSPRDQHLSQLRSDALGDGFRIGSLRVPVLSEYGRVNEQFEIVTLYQKSLRVDDAVKPTFTVVRTTGESGAYLPNGWQWDGRSDLTDAHYAALKRLLETLPESLSVIDVSRELIGISWDEKDPNVTFDSLRGVVTELCSSLDLALI